MLTHADLEGCMVPFEPKDGPKVSSERCNVSSGGDALRWFRALVSTRLRCHRTILPGHASGTNYGAEDFSGLNEC